MSDKGLCADPGLVHQRTSRASLLPELCRFFAIFFDSGRLLP